jgi:hypothetical protein
MCHTPNMTRPALCGGAGGGPLSSGWVATRDTSATANPRGRGRACVCLTSFSVAATGYVTPRRPPTGGIEAGVVDPSESIGVACRRT